MDKIIIKAQRREIIGKKVKDLRLAGGLPAVIYGKTTSPISVLLDLKSASIILRAATSSSLITIDVDGEEYTTLVRELQRDFIRGNYLHVDFLAVSATEKVKARVDIIFVGEAPALSVHDSLLTTGANQLEVESFPQDLPENITVDLSSLMEIGDGIYVRDLDLPDNVEVQADAGDLIVVVSAQILVEEEPTEEEEYDEDGELIVADGDEEAEADAEAESEE